MEINFKKQVHREKFVYQKLLYNTLEPDDWTPEFGGSYKRKTKHILPNWEYVFDGNTIQMEYGKFNIKEIREIYLQAGAVEVQIEYNKDGLTIWTYWPDVEFVIEKYNKDEREFNPYVCYDPGLRGYAILEHHELFYQGKWYKAGDIIPGLILCSDSNGNCRRSGYVYYSKR